MSKDTKTIAGLRFQKYSGGQVHVHDDARGAKFVGNASLFKKEVEQGLKDLKGVKAGVIPIVGTSNEVLYLLRDEENSGKSIHAFVSSKNMEKELKSFLGSL